MKPFIESGALGWMVICDPCGGVLMLVSNKRGANIELQKHIAEHKSDPFYKRA